MTILGISVGSNRTGVCVLEEGMLIDWQIHDYQSSWTDNKLRIIINRYKVYIKKHKITDIMVKIPPTSKQKPPVRLIISRLVALAKKHNLNIDFILKSEIKDRLQLNNTEDIIQKGLEYYSVLKSVYDKGMPNKHRYYKKIFEAVLGAHLYAIMHPSTNQ